MKLILILPLGIMEKAKAYHNFELFKSIQNSI